MKEIKNPVAKALTMLELNRRNENQILAAIEEIERLSAERKEMQDAINWWRKKCYQK